MMASSLPFPPPPSQRLRVFLVRHGETHENASGIVQGHLDTALSPFGHTQAARTAHQLSNVRFDRIITSPLQRARDTAKAILARQNFSSDLQVELDDRLKERCFGTLEGKVYAGPAESRETTTGVEKTQDLLERLAGFWNDLVTVPMTPSSQESFSLGRGHETSYREEEMVVLLVSHGAAISALLDDILLAGQYLHLPPDHCPSTNGNCSITEMLVPTILDRRLPSSLPKPAGNVNLKKEWTIRPPHLGVQGCQKILEFRNLSLQLSRLCCPQSALDNALLIDRNVQDHVHRLQSRLRDLREALSEEDIKGSWEKDVLRGPDGEQIMQDLGYGKGVGHILRRSDMRHIERLSKSKEHSTMQVRHAQVNVDEIVDTR